MALQDSSAPVLSGTDSSPLTSPEVTDSGVVLQRRGAEIAANPASQVTAATPPNAGVPAATGLTMGGPMPSAPPLPPVNPTRPWQGILQGAIWGLMGASQKGPGRGGFGAGLGMGVKGAQEGQQQHFANVQAAANIKNIAAETQMKESQNDLFKLQYQQQALDYDLMLEYLGVPKIAGASSDKTQDFHNQAIGTIDAVKKSDPQGLIHANLSATINPSTSTDGKTTVNVYKWSSDWVNQHPEKARAIVDLGEIANQRGQVTDENWNHIAVPKSLAAPEIGGAAVATRHQQGVMSATAWNDLNSTPPFQMGDPTKPNSMSPQNADGANQRQVFAYQTKINNLKNAEGLPDDVAKLRDMIVPKMEANLKTYSDQVAEYHSQVQANTAEQEKKNKAAQIAAETEGAPALAAAAAQKKAAELAAEFDPNTPVGRQNIAKQQQDLFDKKFANADKAQTALFKTGVDPLDPTKKLNLTTPGAEEMLVDQRTGQPIPIQNLNGLKPTPTEIQRGDFAASAMHILDALEKAKAAGNVPNGPIKGWTAKQLADIGLGDATSQAALNDIALEGSAATAAHTGRFSAEIMHKMNSMINLNMNDSQFAGAIQSIRDVMGSYQQKGYRETVSEYKRNLMAEPRYQNGKKGWVTGFNPTTGKPIWQPELTQQ
jgi:hypothetical protein